MGFENIYGAGLPENRVENDYYPTPPYATFALMDIIGPQKVILEPAAGRGWMARELARSGSQVRASDLYKYEDPVFEVSAGADFLVGPVDSDATAIITNPPYGRGLAEKFIRKSLASPVTLTAMLLRLTFMESAGRYKLFRDFPPTLILPFSRRFSCGEKYFETPFQGMLAFAWYVWEKPLPSEGQTKCKWIDSDKAFERWKAANGKDV